MGRLFSSSTIGGAELVSTAYSKRSIFMVPEGDDQVLRGDGVDHIDRREPLGLERVQIDVHLNLALLAAVGKGRLRSLNGGQLDARC